ncbi:hypothetical protein EIP91_005926 [Steccherinum ochraceum]|uniref:N-acetyltransferase domain-containing protein n=1 Tax=Steccherinum ochraceum TaxID=92696 RepID=A0A4R0RVI2_9APHY|nr:hypothetical protein EIP91_005926 [Steccherinum ochraceum]
MVRIHSAQIRASSNISSRPSSGPNAFSLFPTDEEMGAQMNAAAAELFFKHSDETPSLSTVALVSCASKNSSYGTVVCKLVNTEMIRDVPSFDAAVAIKAGVQTNIQRIRSCTQSLDQITLNFASNSTTALLGGSAKAPASHKPRRATYKDIKRRVDIIPEIIDHDPLNTYLNDTPDRRNSRIQKLVERLFTIFDQFKYVHSGLSWTIDDGDASVCYSDPAKPFPRWMQMFEASGSRILPKLKSKEQLNRLKEVQQKLRPALREVLEEHGKNMMCLEHVGTLPAKQGRGYGTILCKIVTAEADSRNLKTYLVSSNVEANTVFYNRLGFFSARRITLGDSNPTWHNPPFEIEVMVREVPAAGAHLNEKSVLLEIV